MRVALYNPFSPDRPTAESELALRMVVAAGRKGWTVRIVHTIEEVEAFIPDLVVALHHEAPKLTGFPTVGCLWNPPSRFEAHPPALTRVLSYDGFLTAGPGMDRFVATHFFPTHRPAPTAPFYPATHATTLPPRIGPDSLLFYVGSNWDGRRFERLFGRLAEARILAAHGPADGWRHLGAGYAGPLPFDGQALLGVANRCGIGLCLHLPGHTAAGLPNMRVFELAAAGALIVCGRHPFIEEHFGDSVLTVDADAPVETVADAVVAHVHWARATPEAANARAARSQAIFLERFTLERLMEGWPALLAAVRVSCGFTPVSFPATGETVQYVLPVSGAPTDALRHTITSVAAQSHRSVGLILVGDQASLDRAAPLTGDLRDTRLVVLPDDRLAGEALWAGLRATDAPWFGVLEAGIRLFPNHVASLLATADRASVDVVFAHAMLDGPEGWTPAPSDALRRGELPGDRATMPPSAFLARGGLLDDRLLRDPGLGNVVGALYLVRRLVAKATVGAGAASSWLTTLSGEGRSLDLEDRRDIDRLERFDPACPPPATPGAVGAPAAAPPRPAPPGDVGAAILDGVPLLREPRDFATLDPALPVHIFGAGQGGRFVQLELMMMRPDIQIVGFLDSRASGTAWGLPVHRPADLSPDQLTAASIIVASQHVVEILTLLKGFGRLTLYNAYPRIIARTEA